MRKEGEKKQVAAERREYGEREKVKTKGVCLESRRLRGWRAGQGFAAGVSAPARVDRCILPHAILRPFTRHSSTARISWNAESMNLTKKSLVDRHTVLFHLKSSMIEMESPSSQMQQSPRGLRGLCGSARPVPGVYFKSTIFFSETNLAPLAPRADTL